MPKFYVTSRWSTAGVEEVEADERSDGGIQWRLAPEGGVRIAGAGEWFVEREDALQDARQRRLRAMMGSASDLSEMRDERDDLNKAIEAEEAEYARLQALTFDAPAEESE